MPEIDIHRELDTELEPELDAEGNANLEQRTTVLVSALAREPEREAALAALTQLGPTTRAAVLAGLRDGRWEVRRWCIWLTRLLHPADVECAFPLMRDPKSAVRQMAVSALGSGDGRPDAAVPLLMERALDDSSIRVRRQAVLVLAFSHTSPQLEGFFQHLLDTETDSKLHKNAGIGLFLCRERGTDHSTESSSC